MAPLHSAHHVCEGVPRVMSAADSGLLLIDLLCCSSWWCHRLEVVLLAQLLLWPSLGRSPQAGPQERHIHQARRVWLL